MQCRATLIAMRSQDESGDVELFTTDLARLGFNDLDCAPELLSRRANVPVVVSSSDAAPTAVEYRPGNVHELCQTIRRLSTAGEMYLSVVLAG